MSTVYVPISPVVKYPIASPALIVKFWPELKLTGTPFTSIPVIGISKELLSISILARVAGDCDGVILGVIDGVILGVLDGVTDGVTGGVLDGVILGVLDGVTDGVTDGVLDGVTLGVGDGQADMLLITLFASVV